MIIHDNDPMATRLDITSPRNGQEFQPGETIMLRAQIIGPGSSNSWSVDFFDGDQRLGTTQPDTSIWWGDAPGGPHVISACAISSQGAVLTSAPPVTIQVGPGAVLPVVKIGANPWQTGEPCPDCFFVPSILTLERTAPTNSALTVFLEIDGTATAGDDYQTLPASVEIPAGQRSAQLTLLAREIKLPKARKSCAARAAPTATAPAADLFCQRLCQRSPRGYFRRRTRSPPGASGYHHAHERISFAVSIDHPAFGACR
jgi:hypothetical protein